MGRPLRPTHASLRLALLAVFALALLLAPPCQAFGFGKKKEQQGDQQQKQEEAEAAAPKKPAGPPQQVEILTEDNFKEKTSDGSAWLVDFWAPWCGHCVRLNPILDEVAPLVTGKVKIGKVDATQHGKLAREFKVSGYPTIKILQPSPSDADAGISVSYEGPRTKEAFLALAERIAAPSPRPLATPEELGRFEREHKIAFLLAPDHDKGTHAELTAAYRSVAEAMKSTADLGLVSSGQALGAAAHGEDKKKNKKDKGQAPAAAASSSKYRTPPFLAKLEHGEEPVYFPLPDGGAVTDEAVHRWVVQENRPLVSRLEAHNFRKLGELGKLMAIGVVDPSDAAATEAFIERLKEVGRSQRRLVQEHYVLGYLDGVRWKNFVSQFNVLPGQLPRLFVLNFPREVFYEDAEVDEVDEIETFLADIVEGKVPAQRQGGLKQATAHLWGRLVEWYPWSLGLLFPLGLILALCLFPNLIVDTEEEKLREPGQEGEGGQEQEGAAAGGAAAGGEGEGEAGGTKDAASKKNE